MPANTRYPTWLRYAGSGCVSALLLTQTSCGHSTLGQDATASHESSGRLVLSRAEAATLAARLANDECERLYKKRPFRAEQHRAIRQDNRYQLGWFGHRSTNRFFGTGHVSTGWQSPGRATLLFNRHRHPLSNGESQAERRQRRKPPCDCANRSRAVCCMLA
jgi:hypothetical protein